MDIDYLYFDGCASSFAFSKLQNYLFANHFACVEFALYSKGLFYLIIITF